MQFLADFFAVDDDDDNLNLLDFWKSQRDRYPKLASLARKVLSLPASSADCERAFSRLRRVLSDERSRMKSGSIFGSCVGRSLIESGLII